jgi:hypothetical protein
VCRDGGGEEERMMSWFRVRMWRRTVREEMDEYQEKCECPGEGG